MRRKEKERKRRKRRKEKERKEQKREGKRRREKKEREGKKRKKEQKGPSEGCVEDWGKEHGNNTSCRSSVTARYKAASTGLRCFFNRIHMHDSRMSPSLIAIFPTPGT